jgi:hypothetical protein
MKNKVCKYTTNIAKKENFRHYGGCLCRHIQGRQVYETPKKQYSSKTILNLQLE